MNRQEAQWRIKMKKVLEHIVYEVIMVFFLVLSVFLAGYRDEIILGAINGDYTMSLWDFLYFAITGVFLLDLLIHVSVYGCALFSQRPEYKFELFLQLL